MLPTFTKAVKYQRKLRLAFIGPAGSGKTYSALSVAAAIGGKIALIDTEHASASMYAGRFTFDTLALSSFEPEKYMEAITAAVQAGYDVLIIDSISHAWAGKGGVLEFVDQQKLKGGADPTGWGKATPRQNAFVETMLSASERLHVIVTMRSKMTIVLDKDEQTHQTKVRRIGLQPIQRDMLEYEFDLVGDLDQDNTFTVTKTRFEDLPIGRTFDKPGKQLTEILLAALTDGAPVPPPAPKPAQPATTQAATQPAATQAAKPARPFTAEQLQAKYAEACAKCADTPTADGYRGIIAASLDLCFAGQADSTPKVHSLVKYLSGKDSRNDLTPRELRAFGSWLRQTQDSGGALHIDGMAEKEAQIVITQTMLEAGQQALPLDDNEDQAPKDTEPGEEELPF